jgi:hypothetical protein
LIQAAPVSGQNWEDSAYRTSEEGGLFRSSPDDCERGKPLRELSRHFEVRRQSGQQDVLHELCRARSQCGLNVLEFPGCHSGPTETPRSHSGPTTPAGARLVVPAHDGALHHVGQNSEHALIANRFAAANQLDLVAGSAFDFSACSGARIPDLFSQSLENSTEVAGNFALHRSNAHYAVDRRA